jgi:plasmid stabilization system protein ParE
MPRRLVISPGAKLDLAQASDWYDAQRVTLGDDFLKAFEALSDAILRNPFQYQAIDSVFRKAVFRRFQYSLIYSVSDDEVVIVGCFHDRRDPARWQERLRK